MKEQQGGKGRATWVLALPTAFCRLPSSSRFSRSEALAILTGEDEGFDHLSVLEVAVELVELAEPEVVAVEVESRLGWVAGISLQDSGSRYSATMQELFYLPSVHARCVICEICG